jgi:hypothetical protein
MITSIDVVTVKTAAAGESLNYQDQLSPVIMVLGG